MEEEIEEMEKEERRESGGGARGGGSGAGGGGGGGGAGGPKTENIWMWLRTTREGKLMHFRINPDKLQICNYTGFRGCL